MLEQPLCGKAGLKIRSILSVCALFYLLRFLSAKPRARRPRSQIPDLVTLSLSAPPLGARPKTRLSSRLSESALSPGGLRSLPAAPAV